MMLERLPTFDKFCEEQWAHEAQRDADMRAGRGMDGEMLSHRYVGPPHVPTPRRWLERQWVSLIERRVTTRAHVWLMPKVDPPVRSAAFEVLMRAGALALTLLPGEPGKGEA
jgi:hypothetical protein